MQVVIFAEHFQQKSSDGILGNAVGVLERGKRVTEN